MYFIMMYQLCLLFFLPSAATTMIAKELEFVEGHPVRGGGGGSGGAVVRGNALQAGSIPDGVIEVFSLT
jgi:hypothetical protein